MPKPSYHILVCTNSRPPGHPRGSCGENGSNTIFENVIWGSDVVMKQIRVNLEKYNYSWNELDTLWDVDDINDYHRLSALMPQLTNDL